MPDLLEPGQGGRVVAVGSVEVARGPVRQAGQRRCRGRGSGRRPAAGSSARSAWTMVPAGSPAMRASAARYISMARRQPRRARRGHDDQVVLGQRELPLDVVQPLGHAGELVARHEPADETDGRAAGGCGRTSSGSSSTQRRITPSRRSDAAPGGRARPARPPCSTSPAASAWRTAGSAHRLSAYHALARRCSSGTVGCCGEQVGAQHVGEEVVVAVPASLVVEGYDEQVAALQQTPASAHRRSCPMTASQSGPVSRSRIAVATRKSRSSLGLLVEHLLDEVVHDVPVVTGEPRDEPRRVLPVPQRERGELERRDPALGPGAQRGDVRGLQVEPGRRRRGSRRVSSSVNRRSAARTSVRSPRARSRASGSAGSARVLMTSRSCGGSRSSRKAMPGWMLRALGQVVVVEDEVDVVGEDAQLVEDRGEHGLDRLARARAAPSAAAPVPGRGAVECGEDVGPERRRARGRPRRGRPRRTRGATSSPASRPARWPAAWSCRTPPGPRPGSAGCDGLRGRGRGAAGAAARRARRGGRTWSRPARPASRLPPVPSLNPSAVDVPPALWPRAARSCIRSPGRPKMLSTSAGPSPVLPNQCGSLGVELGRLAGLEHQVLVALDEPHPAGSARRATRSRRGCAASASTGPSG